MVCIFNELILMIAVEYLARYNLFLSFICPDAALHFLITPHANPASKN